MASYSGFRGRKPNFSKREVLTLTEYFTLNAKLLFPVKGKRRNIGEMDRAWDKLAHLFNAHALTPRSVEDLKKKVRELRLHHPAWVRAVRRNLDNTPVILASPSSSTPMSTSPLPILSPNRCSTCCAPLRPSIRDCGTNPAPATTPVTATTIVAHTATITDPPPSSVRVEDIYTVVATILAGVQHIQDFAEKSVRNIRDVTGALQVLLAALRGATPTPPTP